MGHSDHINYDLPADIEAAYELGLLDSDTLFGHLALKYLNDGDLDADEEEMVEAGIARLIETDQLPCQAERDRQAYIDNLLSKDD